MSTRSVTATAPGKINVCLRVGPLRPDGYHDLATVFQAVSLVEEVTATESDGFSVEFSGPIDTAQLATDDSNLAIRAARAVAAAAGIDRGAALHIVKNVPIAGGMGGGSADASATLVAVDALWETNLGIAKLTEIAASLGADVPFALHGGTAIGVDRGDELTAVPDSAEFHWVLVFAGEGLSTPDVFRELDRQRTAAGLAPESAPRPTVDPVLIDALQRGNPFDVARYLGNDLQPAAVALRPELLDVLEHGIAIGAVAGVVSGSGPTIALLAGSKNDAEQFASDFTDLGDTALAVVSAAPGAGIR